MSDDWLDTEEHDDYPTRLPPATIDPPVPADAGLPGFPVSGRAITAALTTQERRAQLVASWESLSDSQRVFLNTWRECRFNAARTYRVLEKTSHHTSKTTLNRWLENPSFELVRELLRTASIEEILARDYLAARHEDIVETLLTPKPVLHQGVSTGHYEVEAGAAGKANEVLLRLGGHLKDKELEVNIGLVIGPPTLNIQVMPLPPSKTAVLESVAIDAKFTEVPDDDEWLGT